MEKAAIVHFTDGSEIRPIYNEKTLNSLREFASFHGYDDVDIFCDKSLLRCERVEFDRFLSCYEQYSALFTKDFYHIADNTMKCMSIMKTLRNQGLKIHTQIDGTFNWQNPATEIPLRVATYTCYYGTPNELKEVIPIKNDIFKFYVSSETKWNIIDQYYDKCRHQKDGDQIQLIDLITNKDEYDLLLVHNMNDIHWRTSKFCKIRQQLGLDIYSLQEGCLKIGGKDI